VLLQIFSGVTMGVTGDRIAHPPAAAGSIDRQAWGSIAGTGPGINLVFLGESTVAGVGASTHQGALACKMATFLSRLIDRTVYWRAIGRG
jgi:hypothetical protein